MNETNPVGGVAAMSAATAIDVEVATLEQLENLELSDLLGGDVTQYDLSNNLPDCMVGVFIEKYELKSFAADPENGKKASVSLSMQFKVLHVFSCDDRDVDPQSLVGRMHFESFPLLTDFGKAKLIKLILGIVGVSFTDKKAWADVGGSFDEVLAQLVESQVQFGLTIKNTSKNGYDNCNFVDKPKMFIDMKRYQETVG